MYFMINAVAGTSTSPKTFRQKAKFVQGVIEIQNPNLVKPKTNAISFPMQIGKTCVLSRRESEVIEKQRAHEHYMKLQEQGKAEQSRKDLDCLAEEKAKAAKKREEEEVDWYVSGGGIQKGRVGGKSIKNLYRKNRSAWNLPYWKPFLMALRSRKKQQRVKEGTAARVKMAAKICHSPKSEYDLFIKKFMEDRKATVLETKKTYFNRMPTYIGYSDDYKGLVNDYY
ncbi:hypothetical protein P8452_32955 [Trifolium repens]|nr:hypothetical protein P8452_32955 [Trifolium repens]